MKDEVEKLREILNKLAGEEIPGWIKRAKAVEEAEVQILTLFQKAQVEAVRAELEGLFRDDRSYVDFVDVTVIEDRLANLKEDGETK